MLQAIRRLDSIIFSRFEDHYPLWLERAIGSDCESILDVGCGSNSPLGKLHRRPKYSVGVDGFERSITTSRSAAIHDSYRQMNILDIEHHFEPQSFDCVLASDVIEHLEKSDGLRLLTMMETIARKKVIVFTPNGFLPQGEFDENPLQRHLSGWDCDEMQARGYQIIGINGWKPLRGAYNLISWKPARLWQRVSLLTQPLVEKHPKHAFQILCTKSQETRHRVLEQKSGSR